MTVFLCHLDDLSDDDSRGFELPEGNFFAVRKDGGIYVYVNSCPHIGVPLEWQPDQFLDCEKSLIQCATHGALFRIENGECVAGPCLTKFLQSVTYTISEGNIFIDPPLESDN